MGIFSEMVDDLLRKGLVRPNISPYASPAFLVPKSGGGSWMVVDYLKVNSEIVFYSYPLPTMEQTFHHFGGAVLFKFGILSNPLFV